MWPENSSLGGNKNWNKQDGHGTGTYGLYSELKVKY